MSNELKPFLVIDGKTYEITKTRFLITKYEELVNEMKPSDEKAEDISKNVLIFQRLSAQVREASEKLESSKQAFYDEPNNADLRSAYKIFKEDYNEAFDELVSFEAKHKSISDSMTLSLSIWERLLIEALSEQHGLTQKEAKEMWENHVDEMGENQASEWLFTFYKTLFEKEEKSDPFLERAREMQNRKAQQKSSLNKVIRH
jgi:hypothetical protein